MAVDRGNVATGSIKATSITVSHTLAGSGRTVVIYIGHKNTRTVNSVTYGGVACTLLGSAQNANAGTHIYYRENVSVSGDAVATFNNSRETFLTVIDYGGNDTPTDYNSATATTGTSSSVTVSNASTDDLIEDCLLTGKTGTAGADQTETSSPTTVGGIRFKTSGQDGADGGVMSWTFGDTYSSQSACRIPASGVTPPTTITAEAGSYAYSGQDAGINRSLLVSADAGAYAYTGQDADILRGLRLAADPGAYAWAGQDVDINVTAVTLINAEAGAYAYAGQDVDFRFDSVIAAEAGAYNWAGQQAEIVKALRLIAEAGAYSWAGQQAEILANRLVAAEAGSYAWTGEDAAILRAVLLEAEGGAYNTTGGDATITVSAANTIVASAGNYSWLGQQADLLLDRILVVEAGAYNWAGQNANIILPGEDVIAGGLPRRGRRRFVLPDGRVFFDPDEALFELQRLLARKRTVDDIKPLPAKAKKKTQPRKRKDEPAPEPVVVVPSAIMQQVVTDLPVLIDARSRRDQNVAPIDPALISVLLQRVDDREAEMLLL